MTTVEPGVGSSGLVARVKNILMTPKTEWDVINAEPATIPGLYTGYICLLAAIPPVATLIHSVVFGYGILGFHYRPSLVGALETAVTQYVLALISVFVLALVVENLAPNFGGQKDRIQAFKLVAYSMTAAWVAGAFLALPIVGILAIAGLYSLYLIYLGVPRLMKVPEDKTIIFTVVVIIVAAVLIAIIQALGNMITGMASGHPGIY